MSIAVLTLLLSLIVTSFCLEDPLASQSYDNDRTGAHPLELFKSLQVRDQSLEPCGRALAAQLAEVKGQLQALQQARKKVSFFVQFSQYNHQLTSDNVPLVFDNVIFNIGDGYQRSTGRFVAPVAGTYVFLLNILQPGSNRGWANIVINKNQDEVALTTLQYMSSSLSLVLVLQAGDSVWVMKRDGSTSIYGINHTTFSGTIIH